ncbi:hypothetical protein [Paraburkholderia graminis]|uniref:hypothetical protein n=1 Tax=Paraburkholderia graminis TaxID=60548 RepID=UPI00278F356F|nr:hypothetical protein [Paraburkholderia graminis]MDQ0627104.1 hypothetical protein [Paraburkholderia graminis]
MSKKTLLDATLAMYNIGSLTPNSEFKSSSRMARHLPDSLPVLTANTDEPECAALLQSYLKENAPYSLGFGNIPTCSLTGRAMQIMTIRLQVGGIQFYWLADMSDPEVWQATDAWRNRKAIPVVIGHADQMAYVVAQYEPKTRRLDEFRADVRPEPLPDFFDTVANVACSGIIEAQATTDMTGVELERVVVNVLVSSRLERYVGRMVVHGEAITADGVPTAH